MQANEKEWILLFTANGFTSPQLTVPRVSNQSATDLQDLTQHAEALSRADFADWLKSAGFKGQAPAASDAAMPDEIENRLSEMTIFSQFAAVRQLHAAIREHGASSELLGGLVRGYANLGELTRHLWPATTYVFAARSLLYAQRLVVKDPTSPVALWHRAYAEAMSGLHAAAVKDLISAGNDLTAAPPWAALIEPFCKFDGKKLLDLAASNPQNSGLATFLTFLVVQDCGSQSIVMETGGLVLEKNPQCECVADAMCEVAGVSYLHRLTENAFTAEVQAFRAELPRIQDLPDNVRQAWQTAHTNPDLMADVADVSQAFVDSPDASEPSWSALGRILQEGNFKRVYRRAYFMLFDWSVDTSDFIRQSAPLVKGHPMEALIDGLAAHAAHQPIPDGVKTMKIDDATFRMNGAMRFDGITDPVRKDYRQFWLEQNSHCGCTAWDIAQGVLPDDEPRTDPMWGRIHAHMLQVISPFSPVPVAYLIRWDDPQVDSHLDQWSKDLAGRPGFDMAAAKRFIRKDQQDKAIPYLQDFLKTGTDRAAYEMLAQCFLKQNDEAKWLSTLQASLQQEDYALDHPWIDCQIADHFMDKGDFTQAKPYADAAAESWAGWAMECAVRCDLGLKDYNDAIQWAQNIAQRYNDPVSWYFACRTTGLGDIAQARAAMQTWVSQSQDSRGIADFYAGEKDEPNQINTLTSAADHGDPISGLWLAMIYDARGKSSERDAAIRVVMEKGPSFQAGNGQSSAPEVKLAELFQKALAGNNGKLDMAAVGAICDQGAPGDAAPVEFFAGKFLLNHGEADQGLEMLKRCAKAAPMASATGRLARMELHDKGIEPYGLP